MSESSESPSVPNGTSTSGIDPLKRLSSFKAPKDYTLSSAKPNKKVFTPNLNVSRNKNKGALPTITRYKKNDKNQRDKKSDRNKNQRNGPNIIKSSGVFSQGMGETERRALRSSYGGREAESAPVLQKPTIRVKDMFRQVDKEKEQQKINRVVGDSSLSDEEMNLEKMRYETDAPVRLPLGDGGWLHSKPKILLKAKQEVVVKVEPEENGGTILTDTKELKPVVKKEGHEETDVVSLLTNDKPTLIMLQFPDSLPGRGHVADDDRDRRRQGESSAQKTEPTVEDNKCTLSQLEEGKIGKLRIHKSGRVTLLLGNTLYEVAAGAQASFRQEVVSVAADEESRSANIVSLGPLPHKLNILPNWERLLADIRI